MLAEQGCDFVYGAHPLKRGMRRELQDPLALPLLEGRVLDGETVDVGVDPDEALRPNKLRPNGKLELHSRRNASC